VCRSVEDEAWELKIHPDDQTSILLLTLHFLAPKNMAGITQGEGKSYRLLAHQMAHCVITEQSGEKGEHPTGLFQGDGGVQVAVRGCEIVRGYHQECQVYREKNPDEDQVPVDFEVSVWVGREKKKQSQKF
jgi:hypothetical protein